MACMNACQENEVEANFEDQIDKTIYDYIVENDSLFNPFLKILTAGHIDKTLSAYNPYGDGYTLFLPDSMAVMAFIAEHDEYNTLDDLLDDHVFVDALSRYHVVELAINANDFPFGALPATTLSFDYLTISFVSEPDTAYYKINNQAPVIRENIELANGYIHLVSSVLNPITETTWEWLQSHDQYTIFTELVELTGLEAVLDADMKDAEAEVEPVTLLVEPDSIYHRVEVFEAEDLVSALSPDRTDYTSPDNPIHNFVGYHILTGSRFLDDFAEKNTNYTTHAEVPLNIDGEGLDLAINKGKFLYDIIVENGDTTLIDYIGFYYDESNVITKSGAVHFINQIMTVRLPSRRSVWFEFWEEPLFNEFREEPGEYIIEDSAALDYVYWEGAELIFVKSADEEHPASNEDYLFIEGDFTISYTVPKVVQGEYNLFIRVDRLDDENAVVEVFIDGNKIGSLIDLSTGTNEEYPFENIELGEVNFVDYRHHTITVKSLIPGKFSWDQVHFEPL